MAAVTIWSDFGGWENKFCHCFHCFPIYLLWSDAKIFGFWMLSFKPASSLSFFTFIKRLFSSSSLSAIRVVSSAYLRLWLFLPAILTPGHASSILAFCMMYSVYKLNKQGESIQPWRTPFPIWNQSVVPCPVPTIASWSACRFIRRQVRWWSGIPISLKIFQFAVIHIVKGFCVVNEADVFLEFSCFLYDSVDVGNLISGSSAFSKSSSNIWSSGFMYCWSLDWRILSITLLVCEMSAIVR